VCSSLLESPLSLTTLTVVKAKSASLSLFTNELESSVVKPPILPSKLVDLPSDSMYSISPRHTEFLIVEKQSPAKPAMFSISLPTYKTMPTFVTDLLIVEFLLADELSLPAPAKPAM